jgi:hypothetical protein
MTEGELRPQLAADIEATRSVPTADGEPISPVIVDLDELMEARRDPEILQLLQSAAREGAQVKAEGRQRW